MVIDSAQEYIPFVSEGLARRLPNIRTLWLVLGWARYPPKDLTMVGQYPITQLYIHFQQPTVRNFGNLFRLVVALLNLRQLHAAPYSHGRFLKPVSYCPPLSDAEVLRTTPAARQPPILEPENLHCYALGGSDDGTVFYPWITSALSRAQTHAALRVVRLRFWRPGSVWTCAPMSRYGFLDMLATCALEDALCSIPNLSQLVVELPAGPGDAPDVWRWWEAELRKRFVRLKAQISATVHPRSDTPSQSICRPIWIDAIEETPHPYQILSQRLYPVQAQVLETEIVVAFDYVPSTQAADGRGGGVSRSDEPAFPHDAGVGEEMDIVVAPSGLQMPPEMPLVRRHRVRGCGSREQDAPITRAALARLVSADLRALMEEHTLVHNGTAIEFARLCLIEVHQVADDTLQALFGIIPAARRLTAE
ncbi:hypothetical protein TRAPUB_7645 [Trametes pubescens]|uniref:Uncharacterized protein n=1 Tax=Trametes pubescens TaxID=154538 RepID=A0A1M2V2R5_TRAPU|nr:hypothetical protein TRAPUB_7645 [Trametes pubescens]